MMSLPNSMLLKNLIKGIPENKKNVIVSGISSNSKNKKKILYFLRLKEKKINGEKFIKEAIKKGASIIICSKTCNFNNKDVIIIKKKM